MFVAHRVCEQARILNEETILKHWASAEWICQFAVDSHAVCNSPLDKNKENKIRPKLSKEPVSFIHSPAVVVVVCCNLLFWFKFSYFFLSLPKVEWSDKRKSEKIECCAPYLKTRLFSEKKKKAICLMLLFWLQRSKIFKLFLRHIFAKVTKIINLFATKKWIKNYNKVKIKRAKSVNYIRKSSRTKFI